MATYLTLEECKTHLRVDFTDDDTYIEHLMEVVEELVKTELSGTFAGVGTVTTDGTTALVGSSTAFTDYQVGDSIFVEGETERTISVIHDDESLSVSVAFSSTSTGLLYYIKTGIPLLGGALPYGLKHAMLFMVGHFYALREPMMVGVGIAEVPMSFKYLIHPYKNFTVA